MKTGLDLQQLATELSRRAEAKRDFLVPTQELGFVAGKDKAAISLPAQREVFPLTTLANTQLATWAKVPVGYYKRMLAEAPELLERNIRHWMEVSTDRRMLRTLDGNGRAFLSDRYQRIDNEHVAEVVFKALEGQDTEIKVASMNVTDEKLYMKFLFPRVEAEVKKGDVVQAGVVVSNGEIGNGSVRVEPLIYRLVCLNGMVASSSYKRHHVGARIESEQAELFSEETLRADDKAVLLKIRDMVRLSADEMSFELQANTLKEAAGSPPIQRPVKGVEELSKAVGLNQLEGESVLERLLQAGDYTKWGAANAVTSLANDTDSYDRASELEVLGGRIINLSPRDWQRVAA